jgi:hypothetical protein
MTQKYGKVTFVYMIYTDGTEAVMQVSRGIVTKRGSFRPKSDVCKVRVTGGVRGVHERLAAEYQTAEYPSFWAEVTA